MTAIVIDAHQHVWDLERARYDWLGPALAPIHRSIDFAELRPSLKRNGIAATVLVQSADNDDDTDYMLEVAAANDEVVAVVAWVRLDDPVAAERRLDRLRGDHAVVGVRALIHDMDDPDWLLRPAVDDGLGVLEDADVTFDVVSVLPRHLEHVPIIGQRHPRLRIVLDHLSAPPFGRDPEPWWSLIARAAENPMVHAKVSGLYAGTGPGTWSVDGIRPYFERALDRFGAERLMYGGDWPISIPEGGYDRVWEGVSSLLAELPQVERDQVLGGTAARFYRIDEGNLQRARRAFAADRGP